MKTKDEFKITFTGDEKIEEITSEYNRLRLIAYRLKDVKTLFPKKRALAEAFVKNISF